jgi:hypothetical protein
MPAGVPPTPGVTTAQSKPFRFERFTSDTVPPLASHWATAVIATMPAEAYLNHE